MHEHTWDANHSQILVFWNTAYSGLQAANFALLVADELSAVISSEEIAEARGMRAFYYYLLLDILGNVPLVTEDSSADVPAPQASRQELFDFIEQELLDLVNNLDTSPSYGHFDRGTAHTLLAKLYLNAEVYTGTPQWEKAKIACDNVINSGRYMLNEDFSANFTASNHVGGADEIIFPCIFFAGGTGLIMDFARRSLHPAAYSPTFPSLTIFRNWATTPEFYQLFDVDNDIRTDALYEGQQFNLDGSEVTDGDGELVNYTVELDESKPFTSGVRIAKYPGDDLDRFSGGNDFIIFRYADVLLMKAEALNELNDVSGAVELINQVRARAFNPEQPLMAGNFSQETMRDQILKERANELFWEGTRRQDLIRHGKFCEARPTKPADDDCGKRILFPLPRIAMEADPALVQNPGY